MDRGAPYLNRWTRKTSSKLADISLSYARSKTKLKDTDEDASEGSDLRAAPNNLFVIGVGA